MFSTKKDVDQHVRSALSKLKSENEKKLRGFPIAKLYYRVNEYETARHYISMFLSVKEDCAPAHKLLGQCYQKLKKPQKALESFQRSLQLDPKQPDLLIEVCKLLLNNDDNNSINMSKAKYWCDLAESQKVQHEIITDLRSKLLKFNNMDVKQIEEILLKEITLKPNDPNLKIRLVKHYIEQNKISTAFKYVYEQELKYHDLFINCFGWYNIIWLTLNKYKQQSNTNKNWEFWLLLIICLERQVEISFTITNGSLTETANLLFNFDQYMYEAAQYATKLFPEKEFADRFIDHFRGQLCLYASALIFKREQKENKNQWKESIKNALPLLLLAFQCGTLDIQELWLKHCDDKTKQLIQLWNREGAFRCAQVGRTLLSCIRDNNSKENIPVSLQVHQVITEKVYWTNSNDLLSQIRSYCSDTSWRNKIYRILFANSDQISKTSTSFLINSPNLNEPSYELPLYSDIETYEEIAQYLRPQSLQHMVYLCLGTENLSNVRCKYFNGLHFSVQNLNFCGSESLNQLDIETFLYATTIQAKRLLEIEKTHCENYNSVNIGKPIVLPFVNMTGNLCTEEQSNWWTYAYQVYKNLINGENLGEIRAILQYGIEAVRGINGPKMDLMIILKLGKIFMNRSQDATKSAEKNYLEHRTEMLYKHALNVYKLHVKGILEPFRKLFRYSNSNSSNIENEMTELAEEAVTYLAARYFKKAEYEECIEEFSGIELPFATYFQAEAYKKLDESNKTPKKTKKFYLDKARECLNQTVNLLNFPNINLNHPLNSIVHSEIKRLQFIRQLSSENVNNGHFSGDNDRDFYSSVDDHHSSYYGGGMNRSRRESSPVPKLLELESLVKQIATTLTFVKEELVDMIKPEVKDTRKELVEFKSGIKTELSEFKSGIKTELNELRDKLLLIEESMKKKSQTPSRDDTSNVLDDLYLIGDELQNQVYSNQANLYSGYVQQLQPQQRIHTPSALPASHHPVMPPPSTHHPQSASPWYSSDYFTPPQYINPGNVYASAVTDRQHLNFNQRLSFPDTTNATLNFNMPPPQPPSGPLQHHPTPTGSLQIPDNRANIFGFIANQQQPATSTQTLTSKTTPQPLPTVKNSPALWNRVLNNAPVEKGPPVNVVITSSDPLPTTNVGMFSQPALSVTIPPQHIKSNFAPNESVNTGLSINQMNSNTSFPMMTQSFSAITTATSSTAQTSASTSTVNEIESSQNLNYSESPSSVVNRSSESNDDNELLNKSADSNAEYDPRPDFKPIIPLPAEVEVKTGEEDEEVLFCSRAKLFRHVDKEWKERGTGHIKILKSKKDGRIRILMRRDQTHKICANHFITGEMDIIPRKNENKSYIWAAKDYADEEERSETLCVRFKQVEIAKQFHDAFIKARDEVKNSNLSVTETSKNLPIQTTETVLNPVAKSNIFNFNNTSTISSTTSGIAGIESSSTTPKSIFTNTSGNQIIGKEKTENASNKSPFSGFTFDNKTVPNTSTDAANKPFANLFANFITKSSLSDGDQSKISNTFSNITNAITPTATVTTLTDLNNTANSGNNNQLNKVNTGEEDDFVPTAEFKPVIPLPDLVEVQTGEESEIVLFEHRAKLFRYDKVLSQWKERGIGNIKLLVEKNNLNRVRLVMRREQVLKVCINLRLTKAMVFKPSPNSETSLQFGGKDYSDDETEGKIELFTIRFKEANTCKCFHEAILKAQENITETNETDKENVIKTTIKPESKANAVNTNTQVTTATNKNQNKEKPIVAENKNLQGFGDQFKPKAGSWSCNACYISNTSDALYCMACESPKDNTVPKKPPKNIFDISSKGNNNAAGTTSTFTFGFGSGVNKPTISNATTGTITNTTTITTTTTTNSSANVGFGDKFKPKAGSWSCKACYLSNEGNVLYCVACDTPKDDTVPKKDTMTQQQTKNIFGSTTGTTFTFGFNQNSVKPFENSTPVDLSKQQPFKFGGFGNNKTEIASDVSNVTDKPRTNIFSFDTKKAITTSENDSATTITTTMSTFNTFSFSTTTPSSTNFGNINNSNSITKALSTTPLNSIFDNKTITSASANSEKISKTVFSFSMPTNNTANDNSNEFKLEKKEFSFVLKPKSPGKAKSPLKNNTSGVEDESDNENVEEENNAYFTPVIPLPDKIEVKTGEENEDILYAHRAKLYRFTNSEWKERGIGDVKILRHKDTKKLRVVMRREQVLKICLNHVLTDDVEYMPKDDKSWHFVVKDFSEGELELTQFCLRFKTKEIAEDFMKAIKDALNNVDKTKIIQNEQTSNEGESKNANDKNEDKDNVKSDTNKDDEQDKTNRKLAEKLQLPLDFFEKTNEHENCEGCRGCEPDNFVFPKYNDETKRSEDEEKNPLPLDMSGMNFNKKSSSGNSSILRQSALIQPILQKENKNDEKTSIFSGALDKNKSTNVFNLGDNINLFQSSPLFNTTGQKSIFGGNLFNTTTEEKVPETTSTTTLFSSSITNNSQQQKFIFGNSQFNFNNSGNKSIFGTGKLFGTPESTEKKDEKTENTTTAAAAATTTAAAAETETTNLFKDPGISFSDLAAKSSSNKILDKSQEMPAGGFYGLTQNDAFKNFLNPQYQKTGDNTPDKKNSSNGDDNATTNNANDTNDDTSYDPHYDPIIELPEEIKVVTGEENEEKLFGERATLFRYDSETKQWKERGVGELKILYHPTQGTYRLILRREQIHKLVLNHAITHDFSMKPMNNSGKAYCWAAQNYVEDTPVLEKLACRFKHVETGQKFEAEVNKCIEQLKKRADLEPEED